MKTKISKISALLFLSILISFNAFAQWKYPAAKAIKNDVFIRYDVKYDRVLTEKEKQSLRFKKEIIVVFNNNKLLEKNFSNRTDIETFSLFDYDKKMSYQCLKFDNRGEAISSKFSKPMDKTMLQEGKVDTIVGLPCQVSTTKIKDETREIYTTKAFGLKYVNSYKTEGFLLKYVALDEALGAYTVTAKEIFYTEEPDETIYSLEGFTIRTRAEYNDYLKEKNEPAAKKTGKLAPKYSVTTINGEKLKSKDMVGKVVVFNFWFTHCSPCVKEIPDLNALREKFKDENVEFIAVALDSKYVLNKFLEQHSFTYDIVHDGRWIAQKFEIKSYPTNIIIDKNGAIHFYKGYKSDLIEMMSNKIENLLNE